MSCLRILRVIFSFLLLFPILLFAQGQVFWQENGVCVCNGTFYGGVEPLSIVKDGFGGAIIIWADSRGPRQCVYAQKIDSDGNSIWTENGILLRDTTWGPARIHAVSDGKGGAIGVWEDGYTTPFVTQVTAQRIDSEGQVKWGRNGIVIAGSTGDCMYLPTVIPDDKGGAIVAWWVGESNPYSTKIFVQRVDSLGNICWTPDGILITDSIPYRLDYDGAVSDGEGGIIVVWTDSRNGNCDIFAQRIDNNGTVLWDSSGVEICIAIDWQCTPVITRSEDNVIIIWSDERSGDWDLYAQMLNSNGEIQWRVNGVPVCSVPGQQAGFGTGTKLKIIKTNDGGALFAWDDRRIGNHDLYMQRVDSYGNNLWNPAGICITTAADSLQERIYFDMTTDSRNGAIICWSDYRNQNWDIYCQKINDRGIPLWGDSGLVVCTDTQNQLWGPVITNDNSEGAIIAWGDMRPSGLGASIYAQRVGNAVSIDKIDKKLTFDYGFQIIRNPTINCINIKLELKTSEHITIKIYNRNGQLISKLVEEQMTPGTHTINWNCKDNIGKSITSGVYFCELKTNKKRETKSLILLKK
jgi:hypothetical protein